MTHIWFSKLTIIGSDNGLSPDRRQAIIWTIAGVLLIGPLGTNFSKVLIEILTFSFKNAFESVVCETAAILSRPQCVNGVAKVKVLASINPCPYVFITATYLMLVMQTFDKSPSKLNVMQFAVSSTLRLALSFTLPQIVKVGSRELLYISPRAIGSFQSQTGYH